MQNTKLTGSVLAALLGSAMFLVPVHGFAETAPAATPAPAAAPAGDEHEKARAAAKAYFDAKLAALHAGLELTPAQAPLWAPVEQAIRTLTENRQKATRAREEHGSNDHDQDGGSPLEKLRKHAENLSQSAKDLKALTDATAPLVKSLDAGQKERLPKLLEGAFKGHKALWAAFDVTAPRHEDGRDEGQRPSQEHGWRGGENGGRREGHGEHADDEHANGDHERGEHRWGDHQWGDHGWHGHSWHHWHHWHHGHHHHHHWNHDEDRGSQSGGEHHWHHDDEEGGGRL